MKDSKKQSERWLRQAEYDLKEAKRSLGAKSYAYAAFFAEQSAQKSLKAFLIYSGQRYVNVHSVGELARLSAEKDKRFSSLIESGKILDRHYLATRYPDALPEPAIPAESYILEDAEEAVKIAENILAASKEVMK